MTEKRNGRSPMFLPEVESHQEPSAYLDAIRLVQGTGAEYSKIWHMFAFRPQATQHLARFTQEILREAGPLTPGFRELIAAYTSAHNHCPF